MVGAREAEPPRVPKAPVVIVSARIDLFLPYFLRLRFLLRFHLPVGWVRQTKGGCRPIGGYLTSVGLMFRASRARSADHWVGEDPRQPGSNRPPSRLRAPPGQWIHCTPGRTQE